MTIQIADQFEVLTSAPIDDRMIVQSYVDMLDIDTAVRYPGMIVYVIDEDSRYILDLNDTFNKLFQTIYDNDPDGLYVTDDFKDAVNNSMTTDDLPEGTTNLYFTQNSLGNVFVREQTVFSTENINPNDNATYDHVISTNFQLMQVEADVPCRLRIYATEAGRTNDLARAYGVAPDPADGVFLDIEINTVNTSYNLTPSIMIYSPVDSHYSQTYFTTTNLDVAISDINVTLTYVNFGKVQLLS